MCVCVYKNDVLFIHYRKYNLRKSFVFDTACLFITKQRLTAVIVLAKI